MTSTTLDGRFTVLDPLAEGALTRVHRATDRDGTPAVLKRLQRYVVWDASARGMLAHEARLLGALRDAQTPALLGARDDGPEPWLATRWVPGAALDIARDGVAAVRGLLTILARVHRLTADGEALAVVHRDVCPANVLVGADGHVTLIDFGIATSRWRPDPDRGVMKGTRGYMAPEVITGARDADARADLFAVGVILAEVLCRRRLYEGPLPAVLDAVVEGPVRAPRELDPTVPAALSDVAACAMAKRPEARYPDAEAFLRALDAARP